MLSFNRKLTPTQATDILSATCLAFSTKMGNFLPLSSYALRDPARYRMVVSNTLDRQCVSLIHQPKLSTNIPNSVGRVGYVEVNLTRKVDSFFKQFLQMCR